jgi:hypothetical protein
LISPLSSDTAAALTDLSWRPPVGAQLILLGFYLENLPASLPIPKHSAYNFSSFALDPDWLADVSEVGAINGFGSMDMVAEKGIDP